MPADLTVLLEGTPVPVFLGENTATALDAAALATAKAADAAASAVSAAANAKSANTMALITALRSFGAMPQPITRLSVNNTPAIAVSAPDGAPGIPGYSNVPHTSAAITYLSGASRLRGTGFPNGIVGIARGGYYGRDSGNTSDIYGSGYFAYEVRHHGTQIEPSLLGAGLAGVNVRILVNGVEAGTASIPGGGSFYRLLLTFPTTATREITFITGQIPLAGISYNGTLTSTFRDYPLVTLIGDSFVEGSGASLGEMEAVVMARSLGFNAALAGIGSTGMIAGGTTNLAGGLTVPFTETKRLLDLTYSGVTDVNGNALAPRMGVVFGSLNDNGQAGGGAALTTAIRNATFTMIDTWRTANGNKPLVFFGPTWPSGSPTLDIHRIRDGIQEAVWMAGTGLNVWFIDRLGPLTSTRSGTYSNAGEQASLYTGGTTGTDPTHPSPLGHKFDGLWCAKELRRLILTEFA